MHKHTGSGDSTHRSIHGEHHIRSESVKNHDAPFLFEHDRRQSMSYLTNALSKIGQEERRKSIK